MEERQVRAGIGLLGGTFDPVHNGHLAVARAALKALHLRCIEFLPAGAPWQKGFVTPAHHRLAMLKLALEGEPDCRVNEMELLRTGPTYTVDTLRLLRERLGPGYPLVLILGGDQWRNLHTWRNWRTLADYANIAVCARANESIEAAPAVNEWAKSKRCRPDALTERTSGGIAFFDMRPHLASATKIRNVLGRYPLYEAMKQLDDWLVLPVSRYIVQHHLYGAGMANRVTPASRAR